MGNHKFVVPNMKRKPMFSISSARLLLYYCTAFASAGLLRTRTISNHIKSDPVRRREVRLPL